MIQFDEHIFQMDWFNHHLDIVASNIHTNPQNKQNGLAESRGWVAEQLLSKDSSRDSTILGSLVIMVRYYRTAQEGMTTKNILC